MTLAADVRGERLPPFSARLREGPLPPPPDFVHSRDTPYFPPRGAAWAAPFFFFAVKHLFGLWREEGGSFAGAVEGRVDGRLWRDEPFVWMALSRSVQEDPDLLLPAVQAELTEERLARIFRDDAGGCPVPLLRSHLELARSHGRAMVDKAWTPNKLLSLAREAADPLARFVELLSDLPGYREDPLQRKTFLLALALSRRPEGFLPAEGAPWPPLLDRHLLRVALRWGAVEPADDEVRAQLEKGGPLPPAAEQAIRLACTDAFARVLNGAGLSSAEAFPLFDGARAWCPEDRSPDCGACFFRAPCARRTGLKAPVVRTTAY